MPFWVKLLLLGMGISFLAVGGIAGVLGRRQAEARVALVESLKPLSATAFDDQLVGANAIVEGVVSPRNRAIFRNFVAYAGEELDVTTDSDGDRRESWGSAVRETPRLFLESDGLIIIGNENYSIERGHELWYDEATLGFNDQPRDGSRRYRGLVAGRPVTAFGSVVAGAENNELDADTIFGGTYTEYLASQRDAIAFHVIFGAIFGAVGLILSIIGGLFMLRR